MGDGWGVGTSVGCEVGVGVGALLAGGVGEGCGVGDGAVLWKLPGVAVPSCQFCAILSQLKVGSLLV